MTLMRETKTWRCQTQEDIDAVIEGATADGGELTKKTIELKQRKAKGMVVEENYKVTTQVDYAGQWQVEGE